LRRAWAIRRRPAAMLRRRIAAAPAEGEVETELRDGLLGPRPEEAAPLALGRFVALLRILAACLAGVNHMPSRLFLIANAAGGVLWASMFGIGGFLFGKLLLQLHHAIAVPLVVFAFAVFLAAGYFVNRYEHKLVGAAEREVHQSPKYLHRRDNDH